MQLDSRGASAARSDAPKWPATIAAWLARSGNWHAIACELAPQRQSSLTLSLSNQAQRRPLWHGMKLLSPSRVASCASTVRTLVHADLGKWRKKKGVDADGATCRAHAIVQAEKCVGGAATLASFA